MKKLNELFPDIASNSEVTGIKINSKEVEKGDIFVCTMGVTADRHDFIDEAISNGACAVVVSKDVGEKSVPLIRVKDTNSYLRELCSKYYDYPYNKLEMIGITGTNGKTTVAEIIYQLLGDDCAYLGTNGRKWKGKSLSMRNTTPDVDRLYKYLAEFVNDECKELVMEASSEAFFRHRLDDIKYHIAVLTNITEDHLNIHKTLDNYIECKCQLFRQVEPDGFSILNSGDVNFTRILTSSKGTILTYGFKEYTVLSPLLGEFNVLNVAAAILVCLAKQMKIEEVLAKVENLKQIEGRLEVLPFTNKYMVMLDYAHTTDALDKILTYLNKIKKNRIITVTGSAGGREREKRPSMGKVVLEKSDYVIFTMDDPREEDVNQIIDDLLATNDLTNYERIIDRKEAIYKALAMAEDDDIVFITGKGRDNYMALGKEYLPYSDYEVIKSYFTEVAEK